MYIVHIVTILDILKSRRWTLNACPRQCKAVWTRNSWFFPRQFKTVAAPRYIPKLEWAERQQRPTITTPAPTTTAKTATICSMVFHQSPTVASTCLSLSCSGWVVMQVPPRDHCCLRLLIRLRLSPPSPPATESGRHRSGVGRSTKAVSYRNCVAPRLRFVLASWLAWLDDCRLAD